MHELVALRRNGDGSYTCTFDHGGSTVTAAADHVVLACPSAPCATSTSPGRACPPAS
ncbi:hypothetical protein [Streptomyces sp. ISL-43]|uniref:hypothetical protein n=1 Tax=Streptomyces sp. ISL-43 TaxID=2819183 RepID=UPI002035EE5F|nr:hypothetical protein [Streptomyces sp. ISL-43]